MGQPALSQAIVKLEEIAGVRLVERTTRSIRLTPAGEEFLTDARRVLRENERMIAHGSEWAHANRGHLTLLTVPSVAHRLLPAIVRQYQDLFPNVQIAIHDHPDPVLRERMNQGDGDLAVMTQSEMSKGALCLPLFRDDFLVLLPRDHRLCVQDTVTAAQLAHEQWIVQRRGALLREHIEPLLTRVKPSFKPIEVSQTGTVTGMVEAGIGISVLPGLICPGPAHTSVVTRRLQRPSVSRVLGFFRSGERAPMPAVRAFLNVALDHVRSHVDALPMGVHSLAPSSRDLTKFLEQKGSAL